MNAMAADLEINRGQRFEFGKNWTRFLRRLTSERIAIAERSLVEFLGEERLEGKSFLDVGSGSGLFSLAARNLGARVHSFDFDPKSAACTRELKRRYYPEDPNWVVEEGSVLDRAFVAQLGVYDIVYSWGVLHHTGEMFVGLENVKQLVAMGGKLFIAIYNDLGEVTDQWAATKRLYNQLPSPAAFLLALGIIAREEATPLAAALRARRPGQWLKRWTEYDKHSARGMSKWHDRIDWIGGWPYERATVESIVDFFAKDGFRLLKLQDRSAGYGCNEYVFRREAEVGTFIDVPIKGGRSLARSYGRRVSGPMPTEPVGTPSPEGHKAVWLMSGSRLLGTVINDGGQTTAGQASVSETPHFAVRGELRALERPYTHVQGKMWKKFLPELESIGDNSEAERQSPVFIFENNQQLSAPHTVHAELIELGRGRFSHWTSAIYFSASDNSDPNANGRQYAIFIADTEYGI